MSSFLNFTNVYPYVLGELEKRSDYAYVSSLYPWVRVSSGVNDGLIIYGNPDYKLFSAAGDDASIYGNDKLSGTIGKTWDGKPVFARDGRGYRPSPGINDLEIEEGVGSLSRKAKFSITCYTLEQLDEITKYFLEPGFTVFLEWGWNTPQSLIGYKDKLDVSYVSGFNSFKKTDELRSKAEGHYDNYLGFITGGSVSFEDGDKYKVDIELTGFGELPAYLSSTETGKENKKNVNKSNDFVFQGQTLIGYTNYQNIYRFALMFNQLPESRKVLSVKNLRNNDDVLKAVNFLNFDESVTEKINNLTDSGWVKWDGSDSELEVNGVQFPEDVEIVNSENKFIRLGTAFEILSKGTGLNGYKIGDKTVKFEINYKNIPITAFRHIFSLDSSKLLIPNPQTPKFSLNTLKNQQDVEKIYEGSSKLNINDTFDNSIVFENDKVSFPNTEAFNSEKVLINNNDVFKELQKKEIDNWGYLEDLYINFDFFKEIISTENFYIKDALLQLLNGLSSAVNGLWDFQIQEVELDDDRKGLTVLDMNFVFDGLNKDDVTLDVNILGADTYVLDSQFSIDIPDAVQNSIITKRLGSQTNTDIIRVPSTLFAKDENGNPLTDKILNKIDEEKQSEQDTELTDGEEFFRKFTPQITIFDTLPSGSSFNSDPILDRAIANQEQNAQVGEGEQPPTEEEIQEQNIKLFTEKLKFIPRASLTMSSDIDEPIDLYKVCNLISYSNPNLFSLLKVEHDVNTKTVSPMLPIDFEFTVHGISGIKRGDKFKVQGIPRKFRNGFFQVTDITHSISETWTTTIKGSYRQK